MKKLYTFLVVIVSLATFGQNVTTVAGLAPGGNEDGIGTAARFFRPTAVAVDASGNLYVADTENHTIRKITLAGVVSTFAGTTSTPGSTDGTGTAAHFYLPNGVAVDANGNVYVTDTRNSTIRKITAAGGVSTLAGVAGITGSTDDIGSVASFFFPSAVAVDAFGNVYVADTKNNTIRKITAAGVVSTFAGLAGAFGSTDGVGSAARFNNPLGLAVDASGNLYVADKLNNTIRKITAAGVVSTFAGEAGAFGSTDGVGSAARFKGPNGVAVDASGNVYVADESNCTIRKITASGVVSTIAGAAGVIGHTDGTGTAARFYYPEGVTVDASGNVYVADTSNYTIRKITAAGVVSTFAGAVVGPGITNGIGSAARFYLPSGVAVDASGNAYVADTGNSCIRKITAAGVVSRFAGGARGSIDGTGTAASFWSPTGVAVDAYGNIYVADKDNNTIRKITSTGMVSTLAGMAGVAGSTDGTGSVARFWSPSGVAVDNYGNVYVGDTGNNTIRKITAAGVVSTLAGAAGMSGSTDDSGSLARFKQPFGVAIDASGNVFVADKGNYSIRKITAAGVVSTFAGTAGVSGISDGTGSAARFNYPSGVAVDMSGNVYVADTQNNTIRKITAAGAVSTLAGLAGVFGSIDGIGSTARFVYPAGLAVDTSGILYVADTGNNTIRKITGVLGNTNFEIVSTLKIYPNPAKNKVTIEMDNLQKATLEVIDITGKEIMKQSLNSFSNTVNMEKLPSGTYLFKVFSDEGVSSHKIIKK